MNSIHYVPSRSQSVAARKTGSEYVLVPLSGNIANMDSVYTLNATGAFIWEQIDGKKSVKMIAELVMNEFEIDRESALNDTLTFIEETGRFLLTGNG